MTAETRRRVFQYGIAIDLVILATGVGFLYPAASLLIISSYIGAAGLTAWKCGWRAAAVAILLSTVLMVTLFGTAITPLAIAAFIAASVVATAIVRTAIPAPRAQAEAPFQPIGDVVAFELRIDQEQRAREAEVRQQLAQALERAAAEQLERQREVAEPAPAIVEVPPEILEAPPAPPQPVVVVQEEPVPPPAIEPPPPIERPVVEPVEGRVAEHRKRLRNEANLKVAREVKRIRREMEEEFEQQLADERGGIEAEFAEHLRREREAAETALRERLERERAALQADLERRLAAERDEVRTQTDRLIAEQLAPEREALRAAAEERLQRERDQLRRAIDERLLQAIQQETRAIDETLQKRIDEERAAIRRRADEQVVAARLSAQKEVAAERRAVPSPLPKAEAPPRAPAPQPLRKPPVKSDWASGMLATITGWLARPRRKTVNVSARKTVGTAPVPRRPVAAPVAAPALPAVRSERKPRLLLVERRRGTADAIAPKIRQRGVEVEIVERWVDAVDEIFRFRPDALLVDTELPDFNKIYATIVSQRPNLPIFVTGQIIPGTTSSVDVKHAGFVARPYDADALAQIARQAMAEPQQLGGKIASRPPSPAPVPPPVPIQAKTAPAPAPAPVIAPVPIRAPAPVFVEPTEAPPMTAPPLALTTEALPAGDSYNVTCYNCRTPFDAMAADWCSCLTRERTLVCTNCLVCFCKAPPSYKEKFWMEAPPQLYDRKPSQLRKRDGALVANVAVGSVTRPLILCVEDDEEIQHIVQRVCLNLGYGFVHAENGLDGLETARLYRPNLILSEAFMPRLDGREMGRMYKEETATDCAVIIMTGLYTDTKYRSEALKRFHVDEYLAKPVSVTDLVHVLQKYLEGTTAVARQPEPPPPGPVRLHDPDDESIELGDLLDQVDTQVVETRKKDSYEICCHNCNRMFDAVQAEWCTDFGRDQTLLCTHCGICFCKAPSVYKERFWIDAPASLFERKMLGSKRSTGARLNPTKDEVTRPLILLVEADENIQLIVRTVVTTMGYGFILGANGQEGLALAREYNPDLILSDAFMPKLDGREMCRLLKEDPTTARVKAIIMTGLYTDRKYRNEALDHFKIDDYVAKPVAVDDLIRLFKKHLPQEMQPTM